MFSLFPYLSGGNLKFNHERHQKNYSPVYDSRGILGRGSGRKEILIFMAKVFPEFKKCPVLFVNVDLIFMEYAHANICYLFLSCDNFLHSIRKT